MKDEIKEKIKDFLLQNINSKIKVDKKSVIGGIIYCEVWGDRDYYPTTIDDELLNELLKDETIKDKIIFE